MRTRVLENVLFISLTFWLNNCGGHRVRVSCPLHWKSDGYGNIPPNAVECGSNDYVARVVREDQWIPGRLIPSKGIALITINGDVIEHETYEVLVNPDNCIVEWATGYGGSIPENPVKVNELTLTKDDQDVFIGRGVIAGMTLGGKVVPSDSAIFIAYEGKEEARRNYQVLRSFYPLLVGKLSRFKFNRVNLAGKEETELIGQDEIENKFNAELNQKVSHSKIVEERFTLTEDLNWDGLTHVSFAFPLWYGSSDVKGEFDIPLLYEAEELTVVRDREIKTEKDVSVKAGSPTQTNHLQVCSILTVIENPRPRVPFTAIGVFRAEGMRGEQVSFILQSLGRVVRRVSGDQVEAVVRGTLSGRFALYASSYIARAESPICQSYINLE